MADIVSMPKLGFDMAEGTLVRWVVPEGESVERGAVLAEIETDKATVEVESQYSGVVYRHLVDEGTSVPIGEAIAVIGEEGEEIDFDQLLGEQAPEKEAEKVQEAEVDEKEAPPKDVKAEKPERPEELAVAERKPEDERLPAEDQFPEGVRASPLARRMAEEAGVDLLKVRGSGPDGRITKKDIEVYIEAPPEEIREPEVVPEVAAPVGETRHIPLSRLRAIIGKRMTESSQQIPHFFVTHEYDVEALLDLRGKVNAMLSDEEKISVNDFIIKGVALALREFPNLNASLDKEKNEIIHHGDINIGVAVAVDDGLLTVVSRNTDRKSIGQISSEVGQMVRRVRAGKVRPEDIEGSTFSVSNMGMFDVEHFIAIINPPEAAILAVGSAKQIPVVKDGEIIPGIRMKATISVDHRVSDGAEAARFLQALGKYLENPLRLMI